MSQNQPQRVGMVRAFGYFGSVRVCEALRLVEDDTAAVLPKRKQRGIAQQCGWTRGKCSFTVKTMSAQNHFTIGNATITAPTGWREVSKEEGKLVLKSQDDFQQATLSSLPFRATASFEDFERLCAQRFEIEKKEAGDGFVQTDGPFQGEHSFGMYFFGGEKETARVFSGYLSLAKRELVTVYVEGFGIAPKDMLTSFQVFASSLKHV